MKVESTNNMFDGLRAVLNSDDQVEMVAIGTLLYYLQEQTDYSSKFNMATLLRAGEGITIEIRKLFKELENEIPYFSGVLKELDVIDKINSAQLTRFLYEFNAIASEEIDYGEWFDSAIKIVNQQARKNNGHYNHTTPESVNKLAISILSPLCGSFIDSVAGFGGGLLEARRFAENHGKSISLFGQELNSKVWAIAKIRLFISGIEEAQFVKGDVFEKPGFIQGAKLQKFDYVYMEAPFGLAINNYDFLKDDPYNRFFYGLPPRRSADLAFISHALASTEEDGKAIVVTTEGVLFRGGAEGTIRKNIIVSDLIEAVISLPSGLHEHTAISMNLVLFNKNKDSSRKNKILLVKAEDCFTETGRSKRVISETDIQKIVKVVQNGEEISEFSTFIETKDIQDDSLLPSRYLLPSEFYVAGFGKVSFALDALKKVDTKPLIDMATFFRGFNVGSKNLESEDGEYRIVKLSDVQDGRLLLNQISKYTIENNAKIDMYVLRKGDLILSIRGQTLKVAIIPESDNKLLLSQNFLGIRCGNNLNPEFLKLYLESPVGQYLLANMMSGTSIATLSRNDVETLAIPILAMEEQEEIMKMYKSKENTIEQKIQELKQELYEMKLHSYTKMGLRKVFKIKN
ncbi:Probable type I restriction enzyme BthVORF4518P M protein [Lysinibacillus sphaericus]|nr:Probable type I restriction enzyme BthVORF4518P M protein [Lysinibacillus sphaericus]